MDKIQACVFAGIEVPAWLGTTGLMVLAVLISALTYGLQKLRQYIQARKKSKTTTEGLDAAVDALGTSRGKPSLEDAVDALTLPYPPATQPVKEAHKPTVEQVVADCMKASMKPTGAFPEVVQIDRQGEASTRDRKPGEAVNICGSTVIDERPVAKQSDPEHPDVKVPYKHRDYVMGEQPDGVFEASGCRGEKMSESELTNLIAAHRIKRSEIVRKADSDYQELRPELVEAAALEAVKIADSRNIVDPTERTEFIAKAKAELLGVADKTYAGDGSGERLEEIFQKMEDRRAAAGK